MVLNWGHGHRNGHGVTVSARHGTLAAMNISFGLATLLKNIDTHFFTQFLLILVNFMLNCQDN